MPKTIHQHPDHDLRVNPPLLAEADFAEAVFLLRFEIQCGHVIEQQRDVPAGLVPDVCDTRRCELFSVLLRSTALQRLVVGVVMAWRDTEFLDHLETIQLRGRLHQPGQHELEERLILDPAEPEPIPNGADHLHQQPRGFPLHDHPSAAEPAPGIVVEVQCRLVRRELVPPDLQQRCQLRFCMGGTQMLQDPALPMPLLHDLDSRRPRGSLHFPQERTHEHRFYRCY